MRLLMSQWLGGTPRLPGLSGLIRPNPDEAEQYLSPAWAPPSRPQPLRSSWDGRSTPHPPLRGKKVWNPAQPRDGGIGHCHWDTQRDPCPEIDPERDRRGRQGIAPHHPAAVRGDVVPQRALDRHAGCGDPGGAEREEPGRGERPSLGVEPDQNGGQLGNQDRDGVSAAERPVQADAAGPQPRKELPRPHQQRD